MRTNNILKCTMAALTLSATTATMAQAISIEHKTANQTVIHIDRPTKYILLPIQEKADEGQVRLAFGTDMDIRLARTKTDYMVPFALPEGSQKADIIVNGIERDALCWKEMKLSNTFDTTNREYYRPVYHHTPAYGWMNDANGLFYKDGVYNLYFQYNPYGSVWGNMHWGHSTSTDLIHWKHEPVAIDRDPMGHIFSGSCIVDDRNSAGYGKNSVLAFYTYHFRNTGGEQIQWQGMAHSNDNGMTFKKYEDNPVLKPFDGLSNFRDPKVFWYEPQQKWCMVVSADKNMRFYESKDLKHWTYLSEWGEGYGRQPNQFECPDLVQLPVDGDKTRMKYVLLVNVNPGCIFGGSATEYFVGDFDGRKFTCDSKKDVAKWLDWGKDHYATVCFSNTKDRTIAVPWMSNWQYANLTPMQQYRSQNALPRELKLFTGKDGELYVSAAPVSESLKLRKSANKIGNLNLNGKDKEINNIVKDNDGAYEITAEVTPGEATTVGFDLVNDKGEMTKIYFDMKEGRIVMDRTKSGKVDFANVSEVNDKDTKGVKNHPYAINYVNDFALGTWAPLNLCKDQTYKLDVFVDKCSVEIFVDGGRIAMTNLVFPTKPYGTLKLYSEGGKARVKNLTVYKLGL